MRLGKETVLVSLSRDRSKWYVVTNAHVVGSNRTVRVSVELDGVSPLNRVSVLAIDEYADVALLDVGPDDFDFGRTTWDSGLAYLNREGQGVATSTDIHLGAEVLAVGFPEGGGGLSVTSGIVSSAEALIDSVHWIKTDAAINPGNSGGPLVTPPPTPSPPPTAPKSVYSSLTTHGATRCSVVEVSIAAGPGQPARAPSHRGRSSMVRPVWLARAKSGAVRPERRPPMSSP